MKKSYVKCYIGSLIQHLAEILDLLYVEVVLIPEFLKVSDPLGETIVVLSIVADVIDDLVVRSFGQFRIHLGFPLEELVLKICYLVQQIFFFNLELLLHANLLDLVLLEMGCDLFQLILQAVLMFMGFLQLILKLKQFFVQDADFSQTFLYQNVGASIYIFFLSDLDLQIAYFASLLLELSLQFFVPLQDGPKTIFILILYLPDELLAPQFAFRDDIEGPFPFLLPALYLFTRLHHPFLQNKHLLFQLNDSPILTHHFLFIFLHTFAQTFVLLLVKLYLKGELAIRFVFMLQDTRYFYTQLINFLSLPLEFFLQLLILDTYQLDLMIGLLSYLLNILQNDLQLSIRDHVFILIMRLIDHFRVGQYGRFGGMFLM